MTKRELIAKILFAGDGDQYYFANVIDDIEDFCGEKAPAAPVIDLALQTFLELLVGEYIKVYWVDLPNSPDITEATGSPEDVHAGIRAAWAKIDFRSPLIGEVFWYELSEKGMAYLDEEFT